MAQISKSKKKLEQNDFDLSCDRKKKIENESNDNVLFSAEFSLLSDYISTS